MMKRILVLFSHPHFEKSRANNVLVEHIHSRSEVTFHDLYECYPDFHIDVAHEKLLLEQHDIIIWHHPFYWYSCPPLMKQWIDMVLQYGWAYGPGGNALCGKICLNVITTGGSRDVYCSEGSNSYSVNEFLRPFEQTANLCGMTYYPPFTVMGTHLLSDSELESYGEQYGKLIDLLATGIPLNDLDDRAFLNDIPELKLSN